MPFLLRYDIDRSKPRVGEAFKDLFLRAILPGVVVFLAIYGLGLAIVGPLKTAMKPEEGWSQAIERDRTSLWNTITMYWSHIGNTEYVIGFCILMIIIVWAVTKEWWYAVIPGIAIALQASTFVAATELTGRPRPEVHTKLDPAPPTSSYPSGHVGAATALYLSLALMAHRIDNVVVRRLVQTICLIIPFLVAFARFYRGMHHASDIAIGMLNGIVCALLAWYWLKRRADRVAGRDLHDDRPGHERRA